MKSKVINKVVYISDKEEICFCDRHFYKTCISRIANGLPCQEMLVRFTPIDREIDSNSTGSAGSDFLCGVKTNKEFLKTLDHIDRMK
ncbi:MAG: hypothetical protein KAS32_26170 [Candidatus Peribacteraceae bacterium]|nr:hypothetical protein [Candidatus Peribacteraceae bacterium]